MDRKILWVGLASLLVIGAVAVGVFLFSKPVSLHGTSYSEPYPVAPEFELSRADGTSFRLSETRGKIVMLFFGYTSCPDVCPTTLAQLDQAVASLGNRANQVQVVFVTVDPQRDTAQRVQEYVNHFNPAFIGLSGPEAELANVWSAYGIFREVVNGSSTEGYMLNHTARITLIDQQGSLRVSYLPDTPLQNIIHDLKVLLQWHDQELNG